MLHRLCLAVALFCSLLPAAASAEAPGRFVAPANLADVQAPFRRPDAIPFPPDNPYSAEAALLGRTLFFDARLSGSGSLACANCHNPSFGWEDGLALGHGEGLRTLDRHTPTILNGSWGRQFFWDGRAPTLEAQAVGPMSNPREMNGDVAALPDKLRAIAGYRALFQRAYPDQAITVETITKAISVFERTLASRPGPFDRWLDGDEDAMPDAAKRGFVLFTGAAECARCHTGWRFTDDQFHDIGLSGDDRGRAGVDAGAPLSEHAFKTPTLRDVARRAPYMHDGTLPDLNAVIAHYLVGGIDRPSRSPLIHGLTLSDGQIADLRAFLESLSAPAASFPMPFLPQ